MKAVARISFTVVYILHVLVFETRAWASFKHLSRQKRQWLEGIAVKQGSDDNDVFFCALLCSMYMSANYLYSHIKTFFVQCLQCATSKYDKNVLLYNKFINNIKHIEVIVCF